MRNHNRWALLLIGVLVVCCAPLAVSAQSDFWECPHEVTIEEIARAIIKLVGSKSQIVYRPLPTDDPKQRRPDITRARTLLGWEPKINLEEGLLKTVGYFKQKVENA